MKKIASLVVTGYIVFSFVNAPSMILLGVMILAIAITLAVISNK